MHNVQLMIGVMRFSHLWSGGRGGGEEEVVKNQAVISISYQVLDEPSKLFLLWPINLFWTFAPFKDWQELKDALEICEAAIVHPEDLRHK